ncbi:MAG: putative hydro-lyase [Boseongicola sp. SB0676_bin_33]|uniref:Putative hydro-lyase F4Y60_11610 n=1 Tax=Boseongicola sp. SB0664_bin_43 TaxID=2604844 RepID=A0A6B0Y4Q2_9RHOB|nr:putative hydro-lyase [Boseongicola sp. SB0664_bin_43]MYF90272.1 putative hydro-lyase [Boseongicola sp. SB0676_bin_33]MYK30951.1 putative hydro-lyase [Boseongicola sp. SB0670_bin_30]
MEEPDLHHSFNDLKALDATEIRSRIRSGAYRSHTAGLGRGKLQANLAILPRTFAPDFMRYCLRNPKPCPLVGVSDMGDPAMPMLGRDIDIRTDVPAYCVHENGSLVESRSDITDHWNDGFVAFALGCSFTFERALMAVGIPLWHVDNNRTVPMYRSNIDTVAAGPFKGPMVVSMRAIDRNRLPQVAEVCKRFPIAHGLPVHWGDPCNIGIDDVSLPDWGDASPIGKDQVPVFWACGVTAQAAIEQAAPPVCITHKPGHMLITDIDDDAEVPILRST